MNKAVIRDLNWFSSHVQQSNGVYLFEDVDWIEERADVVAFADACLSRLGFYLKCLKKGYQCMVPHQAPKDTIFYFEALAVVSVVDAVTRLSTIPSKLLIYSDNTNTVNIFHSLRSLHLTTTFLNSPSHCLSNTAFRSGLCIFLELTMQLQIPYPGLKTLVQSLSVRACQSHLFNPCSAGACPLMI